MIKKKNFEDKKKYFFEDEKKNSQQNLNDWIKYTSKLDELYYEVQTQQNFTTFLN